MKRETSRATARQRSPRRILPLRFVGGGCGLARTFWIGVVGATVAVGAILACLFSAAWSGSEPAAVLLVALAGAYLIYCPLSLLALWLAADRYDGHSLWRVLARVATLCAWAAYLRLLQLIRELF